MGVAENISSILSSNSSADIRSNNVAGGIVGNLANSSITSSYSLSNVSSHSIAGGLVGVCSESEVWYSYSANNVTADDEVGGLIGQIFSSIVSDSYTISNVSSGGIAGGFIGSAIIDDASEITRCYAANPRPGLNSFIGSGLIGTINGGFYLEGGTDQTGILGLLKNNETEMKKFETYNPSWNSPGYMLISVPQDYSIWLIVDDCFYPQLEWQSTYNYVIEIGSGSSDLTPPEQLNTIGRFWFEHPTTGDPYDDYLIAEDNTGELKYWSPKAIYHITEDVDLSSLTKYEYDPASFSNDPLLTEFKPLDPSINYSIIGINKNDGKAPVISNIPGGKMFDNFYNSTISNIHFSDLEIDSKLSFDGFFTTADNSTISNLQFSNITVNGTKHVGSIVGHANNSIFLNCTVDNKSNVSGYQNVGGLIGVSESNIIKNCKYSGTVIGTNIGFSDDIFGVINVGGLVGYLPMYPKLSHPYSAVLPTIENCTFDGDLKVEYDSTEFSSNGLDYYVAGIGGIIGGGFNIHRNSGGPIIPNPETPSGGPIYSGGLEILLDYKPLDFIITPMVKLNLSGSGLFFEMNEFDDKPLFINKLESERLNDCLPIRILIENCISSGDISIQEKTFAASFRPPKIFMVGGLAGSLGASHVENSTSTGNISIYGLDESLKTKAFVTGGIGGLSGLTIAGTFNNSSFKGDLNIQGSDFTLLGGSIFTGGVGGLSGITIISAIENSFSEGNIKVIDSQNPGLQVFFGKWNSGSGGTLHNLFIDHLPSSIIQSSILYDYASNFSTGGIGGLTGLSVVGSIDNCYTRMEIEVEGHGIGAIGGLIGYSVSEYIANSFVSGDDIIVVGPNSIGVGGISGLFMLGGLENCYVTGDVLTADEILGDGSVEYETATGAGGLIGIFIENENANDLLNGLASMMFTGPYSNLNIVSDRASFVNNYALNEFVNSSSIDPVGSLGITTTGGPVVGIYSSPFTDFSIPVASGDLDAYNALSTTDTWANLSNQTDYIEHDIVSGIPIPSVDVWNKSYWIGSGNWQMGEYSIFKLPIHPYMSTSFEADAKHLIPKEDASDSSDDGGGGGSSGGGSGGTISHPNSGFVGLNSEEPKKPEPENPAFDSKVLVILLFMHGVATFCYVAHRILRNDED